MVSNSRRTVVTMPNQTLLDLKRIVTAHAPTITQYFILIRENLSRMTSIPLTDDEYIPYPRHLSASLLQLSEALNVLVFPDPDIRYVGQTPVITTFDNEVMIGVPLVTYLYHNVNRLLGDNSDEFTKGDKLNFVFEWFTKFAIINLDVVKTYFSDPVSRDRAMDATLNDVVTPIAQLFNHVNNIFAQMYTMDNLRMMGLVNHFYIVMEPYDFLVNYSGILMLSTSSLIMDDLRILQTVTYSEMKRLLLQKNVNAMPITTYLSSPMHTLLSQLIVENRPSTVFAQKHHGLMRQPIRAIKVLYPCIINLSVNTGMVKPDYTTINTDDLNKRFSQNVPIPINASMSTMNSDIPHR